MQSGRNDQSIIVVIVILVTIGFIIGYWSAMVRYDMPDCPQEDSCRPDYYNGTWHIIPVQD